MLLQFKLRSNPHRDAFIVGSSPLIGGWNPDKSVHIKSTKDGFITDTIEVNDVKEINHI